MDHTNSAIFQRNYLSRMIRYDTQAAYGGMAPRTELIQAANRMSRRIDRRRPKELTEAQSASIRQEEEIQELRGRRDELFQRIRHQFTFIYRAEGQAIYDQYEKAKRAVDRKIKAREWELMKQVQRRRHSGARHASAARGRCGVAQSYLHLRARSIRVCRTITHRQGLLRPAIDSWCRGRCGLPGLHCR